MWPPSRGECDVSIDIEADGPAPGMHSIQCASTNPMSKDHGSTLTVPRGANKIRRPRTVTQE